jgi:hypothetical protein
MVDGDDEPPGFEVVAQVVARHERHAEPRARGLQRHEEQFVARAHQLVARQVPG